MNTDEIIRMAQECQLIGMRPHLDGIYQQSLARFAALVAAAEREECARVCEKQIKSYMSKRYTTDPLGGFRERFASEQCAVAIRARGNE